MRRIGSAILRLILWGVALFVAMNVGFLVHAFVERISPNRETQVVLILVIHLPTLYYLNRFTRQEPSGAVENWDDETAFEDTTDELIGETPLVKDGDRIDQE